MNLKLIYALFISLLMLTSCSTFERTKTTKVNIEIGVNNNQAANSVNTHQSKKSYSGFQHKTHVTEKMALTSDSSVKE